jgi:hypothetical protein
MAASSASQGQQVNRERASSSREMTETKSAYKTTELIVYVVAVVAVLLAAFIVDGYNATEVWTHFTYLSVAYMISRGLAKAGSGEPYQG